MPIPTPVFSDPTGSDPAELLVLATALASRAAEMLVDGLSRARTSVETKSSTTDMVTEMDRASEALIVEGIMALRPHDGILGEEGTDRVGSSGLRWVIDPLDGTTNYLYGFPGFNVSIGIERREADGTTVAMAGVVVDPLNGDTFAATAGGGATRNGVPIGCSTETDLRRALIATGFNYDPEVRVQQAKTLVSVVPAIRDIRRMGAAAVDLCSVACGRVDGYYEIGLAPWDLAAGALIASEAGAIVQGLDGGPASAAFTIAAPPALFPALRTVVANADRDRP